LPALKTTEGDEVQTALALITSGLRLHWLTLYSHPVSAKCAETRVGQP
jgi:hypothetical protein